MISPLSFYEFYHSERENSHPRGWDEIEPQNYMIWLNHIINMFRAYKFRMYPDDEQKAHIEKHIGSCRFEWNHFLGMQNKQYTETGGGMGYKGMATLLQSLKGEKEWLRETNSQSLQATLHNLDTAFRSFFRHNTDYPAFRSKKDNRYFIVPPGFKTKGNKLIIPKFVEGIEYRDKPIIPDTIKQVVITKDVERYYASIQYELNEDIPAGKGTIGIDMGIKAFLTTSDGLQIEPLNALRKGGKRLKREQRRLSRKKKGSENRKKQIVKLQKIHQ